MYDGCAVGKSKRLRNVTLTPAQHATLRRHVERVQTTLRPHGKQRVDVRHFFQKHQPSSHKVSLKCEDDSQKQHSDDMEHCVIDVNLFLSFFCTVHQRLWFLVTSHISSIW